MLIVTVKMCLRDRFVGSPACFQLACLLGCQRTRYQTPLFPWLFCCSSVSCYRLNPRIQVLVYLDHQTAIRMPPIFLRVYSLYHVICDLLALTCLRHTQPSKERKGISSIKSLANFNMAANVCNSVASLKEVPFSRRSNSDKLALKPSGPPRPKLIKKRSHADILYQKLQKKDIDAAVFIKSALESFTSSLQTIR